MMTNRDLVKILIPVTLIAILFIIWQHQLDKEIVFPDLATVEGVDWAGTLSRLEALREQCGELCDTSRPVSQGDFLGSITSKIDCPRLFTLLERYSETAAMIKPPFWKEIPEPIQKMYTFNNRVGIQNWYIDDRSFGVGRNEAKVWSYKYIKGLMNKFLAGQSFERYRNTAHTVSEAADFINITGKKVLVIGTQDPWLEAILLTKNPEKIVTLEYGYFKSEYPGHTVVRPQDFRTQYRENTLDVFDAVFSFSSLEHSGLGRYGDPLNPWGDIMSVAEAWCVTAPSAHLALAVPTSVSTGRDSIAHNVHRIYGPLMYPYLVTNWKYQWPLEDEKRNTPKLGPKDVFQPVFVFGKILI